MELYTWNYNTRNSNTEDRWDYPVSILPNGNICMLSYVINAHNEKYLDWSRFNDSGYNQKYWNEDHRSNKPVEDLEKVYHKIIREIFSV